MGELTPVYLSVKDWDTILHDLVAKHGQKATLTGYKKRVLGWTPSTEGQYTRNHRIRVDFWDETAKSLFLLEYSEYVKR